MPPNLGHLLNGYIFGFRQKEVDKESHHYNEASEEDEHPILEVAEHCEEHFSHSERKQHAYRHGDALPRRSNLQRENLAGDQTSERAPRPCKSCHVDAYTDCHQHSKPLGQIYHLTRHTKFHADKNCHRYLH